MWVRAPAGASGGLPIGRREDPWASDAREVTAESRFAAHVTNLTRGGPAWTPAAAAGRVYRHQGSQNGHQVWNDQTSPSGPTPDETPRNPARKN